MVRWSIFWIVFLSGFTGLIDWWIDLDVPTWQSQLRFFAAVTFLLAIAVGGIFTFSRQRFYHQEWSFILVIVTLGLFGISMI